MFALTKPSPQRIQRFLDESSSLPLSYGPVGLAHSTADPRYCRDRSHVILGQGSETFNRGWAALQAWRQFDFGWVDIFAAGPPTVVGTNIAVLISHLGFWSLNGGRILYTLEDDERTHRRGYAYGTLTNHAERGEEIFEVSMDRATQEVVYSIHAVSRPRSALAWCGYPIARRLQHRFRRDSLAAMPRAATRHQPNEPLIAGVRECR
jgi:uncharacterized protein (UPF0548 family)